MSAQGIVKGCHNTTDVMTASNFHLTLTDNFPANYSIEQGATWNWLTLVATGDYTGWTPKGQIRDKYLTEGGIIKASFSFSPLTYGEITLANNTKIFGTLIKPFMSAATTRTLNWVESKMKLREFAYDKVIPGRNVWLYDIELESPSGEVIRLVQGFVEVSPEVTS